MMVELREPVHLEGGRKAKKDPDYCDREGIDHAWEIAPWLQASYPPIAVRWCTNCGKRQSQRQALPVWE